MMTDEQARALFLRAAQQGLVEANQFFSSFLYTPEAELGNYSRALGQGIHFLTGICLATDASAYIRIHKGAAFYWLGTFAFLANDYESAAFFFDAAISEDIRAGNNPANDLTPASAFIVLQNEPANHIAIPLINAARERIGELITNYNARPGRPPGVGPLTLDQIRDRFLRPAILPGQEPWRSLATAFISFCLEWDYRNQLLDLRPGPGTAEPFFLHLFKGCVLFESLLKANPTHRPTSNTLGRILTQLQGPLGIGNVDVREAQFGTILTNLAGADEAIETAIEFTGKIRNTVGHDLGWVVNIDKPQYQRLFRMVSSSCLHTIACLYP